MKFDVIVHAPIVRVVGITRPISENLFEAVDYRHTCWNTEPVGDDPLAIPEFGGRVCYESFANKKGRTRIDYLREAIIEHDHQSVLEHLSINLAVQDLPRSTLMELTRHRVGVAYSWRSTRYIDNWITYAVPPLYRDKQIMVEQFKERAKVNFDAYVGMKRSLDRMYPDLPKKQRVEAARAELSNAVCADGLFTCNVRALRHILHMREDAGADASIQEFAYALREAATPYVGELLEAV